jgi:glucose-6-phosphate-specific signal transduction histidine kinase
VKQPGSLEFRVPLQPTHKLEVSDDGEGPPTDPKAGFGLTRVELLGGKWELKPGVAGGSRLKISFQEAGRSNS